MVDARPRRLDHQRLRMAVERGDDELLDRVIDGGVAFDHGPRPRRERPDEAIGEEHAQKGADERGPDHRAQYLGRLVDRTHRSEEHTSELQSLMRISYAVFCLKKKTKHKTT